MVPNVLEDGYSIGLLAELGAKAKKRSFLSFDVADPDLDTPESVKRALIYAMRNRKDLMHYTRIRGLPEFVESVAKFYSAKFALNVDPMAQVLATVGSGEALYIAFSSLTSKGDEFILPNPNFSTLPVPHQAVRRRAEVCTSQDRFPPRHRRHQASSKRQNERDCHLHTEQPDWGRLHQK